MQDKLGQVFLKVEIACFIAYRTVIPFTGNKVEVRKARFFLSVGNESVYFLFLRNILQIICPQMHICPVPTHKIIQRTVCLMKNFREMGGAFGVYCTGNERVITDADCRYSYYKYNSSNNCAQPFFHHIELLFISA